MASALDRRRQARTVQAGAVRVDTTRGLLRRPLWKPNALPWQSRGWDFFDANADLHRGYTIKANVVSRCRLFCAWQGQPDDQPMPLDEALASTEVDSTGLTQSVIDQANDALWRVQSPDGGQAEIQRLLALNLDVAGEGWLYGRDDGARDEWAVYSVEQVRWQGGGYVIYDSPTNNKPRPVGPDEVLIRIWRKHPRYSQASDSAFRALLDLLEQMHLLQAEVTAAASSRLAGSGLLLMDSRVDIPAKPDQDGDYNVADGAFETLLEAMQTAIRDPSSAAAAAPLVFQGEPPDGNSMQDMVHHLTFERPLHEATQRRYDDLRREVIDGADFPPEWVMGLGDTSTYANARIVTQEGYSQDVSPTADLMASALGVAWVRPTILEGGVPQQVADKIVVAVDPDSVISKPDRAKYAVEIAKLGSVAGPLISGEALRAAAGFDEGDAPTDDEIAAWQDAKRALPAGAPSDAGSEGAEDNPNADDDAAVTQASLMPPPIALGSGQPTAARLARTSSRLVGIDVALTDRLVTAADRCVTDGLNRAGAQLRSKAQGSKALKAKVQRVPNAEVFATLGEKAAVALASEAELLDGSLAVLGKQYADWTAAAQASALATARQVSPDRWSEPEVQAIERQQEEDRSHGWAWLAAAMLALMHGRLHDPTSGAPDPRGEWSDGVSVPYGYLRSAVAIAGGAAVSTASGTGAVLTAAGQPVGGIGTGPVILGALSATAGVTTGAYIWLHGDAEHPLDGHLNLSDVEFSGWDDPVLANPDPWPPFDAYFVSDHDGCTCAAERVLVIE